MTYEELKDKYGIYFDTFMLDSFFPSEQREAWFNDGELTEEGMKYFLCWVEGLIKFESIKNGEHPQYPIVKEGKTTCPICGKEVYISPEHELPRYVINHYYCSDCDYTLESHLLFKEAKLSPNVIRFFESVYKEIK